MWNQESEVFPVSRNQIAGVRWMSGVTRGRVDNENNNQSQYSNILNIVQGGVYIYESESIAIRNRNISEYRSENSKAMCTARKHRNAMSEHGTGTGTRIRTGTGTGTKLEREILRAVYCAITALDGYLSHSGNIPYIRSATLIYVL